MCKYCDRTEQLEKKFGIFGLSEIWYVTKDYFIKLEPNSINEDDDVMRLLTDLPYIEGYNHIDFEVYRKELKRHFFKTREEAIAVFLKLNKIKDK
jgi:hypothetical protein